MGRVSSVTLGRVSGVEIVGAQDALAAQLVVRRQLGAQLRVGDLRRQVRLGDVDALPLFVGAHLRAAKAIFAERMQMPARRLKGGRIGLVGIQLLLREHLLIAWHDPVRRTLEHRQVRHFGRDLGHVLHRRRGISDGGHALAAQFDNAIPARAEWKLAPR